MTLVIGEGKAGGIMAVRDCIHVVMNRIFALGVLAAALPLWGQKHELGLTLGRLGGAERELQPQSLKLNGGMLLQAVYGIRVAGGGPAALYLNAGFASSPQRTLENRIPTSTRDVASAYITPALTIKFWPRGRLAPWITGGGGWTLYEHSRERFDGLPNNAERLIHSAHAMFGGGVDVRVLRWIALRGEVRDFYSGSPDYNVPVSGRQHNVAVSGGFVLRFGE